MRKFADAGRWKLIGDTFTLAQSQRRTILLSWWTMRAARAMWWGITITGFLAFLREDDIRTNTDTYEPRLRPQMAGVCAGPRCYRNRKRVGLQYVRNRLPVSRPNRPRSGATCERFFSQQG